MFSVKEYELAKDPAICLLGCSQIRKHFEEQSPDTSNVLSLDKYVRSLVKSVNTGGLATPSALIVELNESKSRVESDEPKTVLLNYSAVCLID